MSYVVDASAVLAFVNNEPGSEAVESVLDNAIISTVNLAEVGAKLVDKGMTVPRKRVRSGPRLDCRCGISMSLSRRKASVCAR